MTVDEILSEAGETEAEALRDHAVLLCLSKVSRHEAECGHFKGKHGESIEVFRRRVDNMKEQEDFELEDDLMDWEYADRALKWWQSRAEELQGAVSPDDGF